jgi:pSer/pThr/pTyr-binding forkhead associated (FHA) protein
VIRDVGSTNGVLANGEQIAREARLTLGDEIRIGPATMVFESSEDRAGPRLMRSGAHLPALAGIFQIEGAD